MKTAPMIAILAAAEILAQTEDAPDGEFPAVTVYIESGFSDIIGGPDEGALDSS
jgi:hypothetical protein